MLVLRGYRVLKAPSGYKRIQQYAVFHKWTNDEVVTEFEFDIFKPNNWRKYLRTFKTAGNKLLPTKTKDGEAIHYNVYFWGSPLWVKEHFDRVGVKDTFISLFPGNDPKTGKQRNIIEHGKID
jgi:hypothetical protein